MSGDHKPWGVFDGDRLVSRHKTRAAAEACCGSKPFVRRVRRIKPGETYDSTRDKAQTRCRTPDRAAAAAMAAAIALLRGLR